jgi:maltose alpha-D-glucosyltransferase/alpha-amylase
MVQPFVRSLGDGWSVMLDRLGDLRADRDGGLAIELARHLGTRTAQLHLALASDPTDPAFASERIGPGDIRRWSDELSVALARTIGDLHDRAADLSADLARDIRRLRPDDPGFAARRAGFGALLGVAKTRVHGDYHLGQTLVTPDGDVVLLDFEGEPARPLEERRQKTSPLKDVAGMLRSFGYARAATARAGREPLSSEMSDRLARWEGEARRAFVEAYLAETRPAGAAFVPSDDAAFAAAVAAWELDKAVYEVNYELSNRPDWLDLPLSTLVGSIRDARDGPGR